MDLAKTLLNIARNLDDMRLDIEMLEDDAEETAYQRLVSKSLKHMSLVAQAGDDIKESACFEVLGTEAEPEFSERGTCVTIKFPSVLKKSRRLAKTADLKLLYDKYEKPIRDYFWDKKYAYGKRYVFWFEYRGWNGDNDNLESKIIIDLIAGYFAPDDTGEYISSYKTCTPSTIPETILRIVPEKDFTALLEENYAG